MLKSYDIQVEEKSIMEHIDEFQAIPKAPIERLSIPQVIINGEYIGGYDAVQARLKGIRSSQSDKAV